MKFIVCSMKGGVGKSVISRSLAIYTNSTYVTNDLSTPLNTTTQSLRGSKKRLPIHLVKNPDVVFDFGAMSTAIDPKLSHALSLCDVVIIPTLVDPISISATVASYRFVSEAGKPIVIIINNFSDKKKLKEAINELTKQLGKVHIFEFRVTTLFDRVSKHGNTWFQSIHNDNGEYQLKKTARKHECIYDQIIEIGMGL